jgi:hypothetical protein
MALQLMLICNKPDMAAYAEESGVDRIFVDLETIGKQDRQGFVDTLKSNHRLEDVAPIRAALRSASLMVRVNPLHAGTTREVEAALAGGADCLMLPMFRGAQEVQEFLNIVDGRARINLLLETPQALARCDSILSLDGVDEVHGGLNDLNLGLGTNFLFEIVANGPMEMLATVARRYGVSFGFGGVARVGCGELPGEVVLGEHARLGSERVILSRAFHNRATSQKELRQVGLPDEVSKVRREHARALLRSAEEHEANRLRFQAIAQRIAGDVPKRNRSTPRNRGG